MKRVVKQILFRFIRETMRIFAPVPLIEREMVSDFKMGDYVIPKGSEIFINAFLVHHNPDVSNFFVIVFLLIPE